MSAPIPEGRWNPTAQRRAVAAADRPHTWVVVQNRGASYMAGLIPLARVRHFHAHNAWILWVDGFEWRVTPDMVIARTAPHIRFYTCRIFTTLKEAQAEAEAIIRAAGATEGNSA